MSQLSPSSGGIRFGDFHADLDSGELRKRGMRIKLQVQPFQVLHALLERPGEVVTREELQKRIWPADTFVDFDHGLNNAVKKLRAALGDNAEQPRFIETLSKRGYRFIGTVHNGAALAAPQELTASTTLTENRAPKKRQKRSVFALALTVALFVLVAATLGTALFRRSRQVRLLTDKDTIVLADFENKTGDPVFDQTLKEGLGVALQQSSVLNILSDRQVAATKKMMLQPPTKPMTGDLARELCQRVGSKALLAGSISALGTKYVIALDAVNCATGDALVKEQMQASRKEDVLQVLGKEAEAIRVKLGESLAELQQHETPLEQATTPSLEALRAYSLGRKTMMAQSDFAAAVPFFSEAVRLDPNFAMAYASLAVDYSVLGETNLAAESVRKAYELRGPVNEWEKFYIESHYHHYATGNLEKARQLYEASIKTYPRDELAHNNLGDIFVRLGLYDRNLVELREATRLVPESAAQYALLALAELNLGRLEDARSTIGYAQQKGLDSPSLHIVLYLRGFLQSDAGGMAQEAATGAGKLGVEDLLLALEADSAAYSGRLREARQLSSRAVASALNAEKREAAAGYEADAAVREAFVSNPTLATQRAAAALAISNGRAVRFEAALALAAAGNSASAQIVVQELAKRFPEDTAVQFNYLPTLRARLALNWKDAAKAIETLQGATPYELGTTGSTGFSPAPALYPVYMRGEAYLAAHQGNEAVAEFQKILDHRGIVLNEPIGALAHLQVGRAYAMSGDASKARTAYQDFLTLWKDADPDIPILKAAKAEYAKLQ